MFCCHVTDMLIELVTHCHHLVAICACFARQRNQNCRTLSVCCHFVASFYRHVTNIVAQFDTSVVLSYHLVAVMWLSYVRQSNYIATLNWRGPRTCHTLSLFSYHLCPLARQYNQNYHTLSVCCHFVASFYCHVTNIVTEFVTSAMVHTYLLKNRLLA